MLDLGNINVNVTANTTGAMNGLNQVADKSQSVVNRIGQQWDKIGQQLVGWGAALTASLTVPIASLGKKIMGIGTDFEYSMSKVQATMGITKEEFEPVLDLAKEIGATTKYSAREAGDGLLYIAQCGWDVEDMINGYPAIVGLAIATNTELATSSDIVTSSMISMGYGTEEANHFCDVLTATCNGTSTSVIDLGEALKYCAPIAGTLDYSIEDLSIGLGILANNGIKGSIAGTSMRKVITSLISPTDEAEAAMKKYGITMTDAEGNALPFLDVINQLREKLGGLTEAEKVSVAEALAGKTGMTGLLSLMNSTDEEIKKITEDLYNSDGAMQKAADTMNNTLQGKLDTLKSSLEDLALNIFDALKPALEYLVEGFTSVARKVSDFVTEHQGLVKVLAVVATALAATGPILLAVGTAMLTISTYVKVVKGAITGLKIAFGLLTSPIGLVIAGIAAVAAGLVYAYKHSEKFRNAVNSLWEKIKVLAQTLWNDLQPVIQQVADLFQNYLVPALKVVGDFLMNTVLPAIVGLYEKSLPYIQAFYEFMIQVWSAILDVIKNVLDWLIVNVPTAIENVKNFFISFGEKCSEIFNAVKDTISGWVDAIVNFFTVTVPEAITAVVDWFKSIPDKIGAFLELAKTTISGWVDSIKNFFTVTVPSYIDATVQWFMDLPNKIAYALGFALGTIVKWGLDAWTYLSTNVPLWIEGVKNFFWELPGKIWDALVEAYNKVCDWASNTWNKFTEACTNIFNTVVEWFSQLPGRISEFITNAYNKVTQWASNMWTKAKEMGSNFISSVVTFFSQLPGKVWEWLNNTISKAKTFASNMKTEASEAANGFKEKIVSGVSSIPDKMLSIGSNIVSGLKNGIKNAWSGMVSWVKGLASDLLSGFKDALGINSPSRAFRDEVGKWIPAGIGEGVEAKMPALIKDMKEQIGGLVTNMNATVGLDTSALSNTMLGNIAGVSQAGTITSTPKSSGVVNYYNDYSTGASGPIEVALKLDGRTLAKETVPYMEREIGRVQKRRSYNRGANLT